MVEESASSNPIEVAYGAYEAGGDVKALMTFYGPDSVWDLSPYGLGIHEGEAAIRGFFEDWLCAYEDFALEAEEVLDMGNGVVFAVLRQKARQVGGAHHVQIRYASVQIVERAVFQRVTNYPDIDEGRAAAERLAESRR